MIGNAWVPLDFRFVEVELTLVFVEESVERSEERSADCLAPSSRLGDKTLVGVVRKF